MNRFATTCRRAGVLCLLALAAMPVAARQGASAAKPAALSSAETRAEKGVRAETIRDVTAALSAPEMEGRGTGTPGGERAAHYIADRFARLGLKPGGDNGTFFQAVPFRSSELMPETKFAAGDAALALGKEFVPSPPFAADQIDASGQLVFVSYAVASAELKRDDFAGLDLKGKVAVVMFGKPNNVDEAAWDKAAGQQAVFIGLITRGVAGVAIVASDSGKFNFDTISDYLTRRSVALASAAESPIKVPPIALVSAAGAEKLFAGSGSTFAEAKAKAEAGEFASRDLGKTADISIRIKREQVTGSNVVAVLEGSDPTLKSQAVLYSAHYDAFGRGADGRIYPGAADNALGVGEMVAIADALAKSHDRPRRSMVFLAVCGEEFGLLGARHWADHPTWQLDAVAANINFDGIGTEIYGPVGQIVGFGAEYSSLGTVLEGVAGAMGTQIVPDPMPEEKAFYRSDHYAFVKKGVPALMLLGGPAGDTAAWVARANAWLKTDYHQATDVVKPDWNWDGARTVAALGLIVGLRVASADAMPEWLPKAPFSRTPKTT